jgi:4-hydroxybutyrate CoA-transferase
MDWQMQYEKKFISPDQAANMIESGDKIAFTIGREAFACGLALAARKSELKNVKVLAATPTYDFGWYEEGWQDSFNLTVSVPTAVCQEALDSRRCDFLIYPPLENLQPQEVPDFLFTEVSTPDDKGFCSFGNSLWNKKSQIQKTRDAGKIVIAEVNKNLIRTYGDNFIHFSEIDYFVEHVSSGSTMAQGSLAGRALKEPELYLKDIACHVSELIKDGDTIQIGVGRTTEPLVQLGMLDGKRDIGYHSEATPRGIISLIRDGVINGKRKSLNCCKAVVTSIGGGTKEEMQWVHMNPLFLLVTYEYLEDLRIIASHENMTAINNALMVDLWGQITAESIGSRILSTPGGQPPFVFGALQAKNGKSITVLPSTARGKSRIVPSFPQGTIVTIPKYFADYVVTEYGIAKLRGKTIKQRVNELVAVAHPDFRSDLLREARQFVG